MKLYLVRHGQALDENKDVLRGLSEKGKLDARKTAQFLKKAQIEIEVILSSRKTRAIETAEIFASKLMRAGMVEQIDGILPNDSASVYLKNIEFGVKDVMLVGHLPFLASFTSLLLNREENAVNILYSTSSVICLEQKDSQSWQLRFSINADLL
ncbi:MAG: phosphohistidine phosphatase SixA [Candidatus Omnitrophica bacterium]|nr:phosphohistidine phosphatase SixA [Candidatus Omnitrophota bacterium]